MAEQKLKVDPPITQVVDGVTVGYEVVVTTSSTGAFGNKKVISDVRAYPVDDNNQRLKGAKQLYRNGIWSKNQITTLTEEQQSDFHRRIQRKTLKFANTTNTTSPQWARIEGSDTNTPPTATATETGKASGQNTSLNGVNNTVNGVIGGVGGLIELGNEIQKGGLFSQLDKFSSSSGSFDTNSDTVILQDYSGYLRYPLGANRNQDSLKMTCFRYRSPYRDAIQSSTIGNVKRNSPFRERLGTIELPMPNSIVDTTSAGWEVDYMNDITMAATKQIQTNALKFAGAAGLQAMGLPGAGTVSKLALIGSMYAGASKDSGLGGLLGANVISMLGSNLGFDIPADQILSRGGGIVSNSNAELLFRGVRLRRFSFNYSLVARSEQETRSITHLIRAFKQWSAPRKLTGDVAEGSQVQAGGSSLFLGTPNIFQLSYMTTENGQRLVNRHVHKFKACALTKFSVNYSPNQQWLSYEGGAPVIFNLLFEFAELEPIYNTDYTNNIPGGRQADPLSDTGSGDLMPIQIYDVGY